MFFDCVLGICGWREKLKKHLIHCETLAEKRLTDQTQLMLNVETRNVKL